MPDPRGAGPGAQSSQGGARCSASGRRRPQGVQLGVCAVHRSLSAHMNQVENLGLTQALATERNARIKDREAYTVSSPPEGPGSVCVRHSSSRRTRGLTVSREMAPLMRCGVVLRRGDLTRVAACVGGAGNDRAAPGTRTEPSGCPCGRL